MSYKRVGLILTLVLISLFVFTGTALAKNVEKVSITGDNIDPSLIHIGYKVNAYINAITIQSKCNGSTGSLISPVNRGPGSYTDTVSLDNIPGLGSTPTKVTFSIAWIIPSNGKMEWTSVTYTCEKPKQMYEYYLPSGMTIDVDQNQISFANPVSTYLSGKVSGTVKKIVVSKLIGNQATNTLNKLVGIVGFFDTAASFSKDKHAWQVFALCATSSKNLPCPDGALNKDTFWGKLDEDLQTFRHKSLTDSSLKPEDIVWVMENGPNFRQVWVLKGLSFTWGLGTKGIGLCY